MNEINSIDKDVNLNNINTIATQPPKKEQQQPTNEDIPQDVLGTYVDVSG